MMMKREACLRLLLTSRSDLFSRSTRCAYAFGVGPLSEVSRPGVVVFDSNTTYNEGKAVSFQGSLNQRATELQTTLSPVFSLARCLRGLQSTKVSTKSVVAIFDQIGMLAVLADQVSYHRLE